MWSDYDNIDNACDRGRDFVANYQFTVWIYKNIWLTIAIGGRHGGGLCVKHDEQQHWTAEALRICHL